MRHSESIAYPPLAWRLYSVWYRHMRVYTRNLFSNGLPPFLEPLIFLAGVGLGLGQFIGTMDGVPYIEFLGVGLLVTAGMWTASFECTYGTFIRLEFEKVYDGMLAAPITARDLIVGELIWAGTKGIFFTFAVLVVFLILAVFGYPVVPLPQALLTPLFGFLVGLMFGTMSMFVTSFVKVINHFNFYFTGLLSPMFFFSGVVFPLSQLPRGLQWFAELVPLTHPTRLVRGLCTGRYDWIMLADLAYILAFIAIMGLLAVRRLQKRMIR